MRHVGIMKSTQGLYLSHQQKGNFFKIVKFTFFVFMHTEDFA